MRAFVLRLHFRVRSQALQHTVWPLEMFYWNSVSLDTQLSFLEEMCCLQFEDFPPLSMAFTSIRLHPSLGAKGI